MRALAALSAGAQRWAQVNVAKYVRQIKHTTGFWMPFHELTAGRSWLTKRAARLLHPDVRMPQRNILAYVVAAFIPYAGRLGGGFGFFDCGVHHGRVGCDSFACVPRPPR